MELCENKRLQIPKKIFEIITNTKNCTYLGRVFCTNENFYFYDTGTGKVFCVEPVQYKILKNILANLPIDTLLQEISQHDLEEALIEIDSVIGNENILSAPETKEFSKPDVEEMHHASIKLLTIEVTEKCNLRCKYCIYNSDSIAYRKFGNQSISFEKAKKAIDFFFSKPGEEKGIGFYGGEPLIEFELIKKCVNYIKETYPERKITFTVTTNGVLVTDEIAQFLMENRFITLFSIDGPKYIHDENRIDLNGNGSYDRAMMGFIKTVNIAKALGVAEELIGINAVLDQVGIKEFDDIQEFFRNNPEIPEGISTTMSYVDNGGCPTPYQGIDSPYEQQLLKQILEVDPLTSWSISKFYQENSWENLVSKKNIQQDLSAIHDRILVDKPTRKYHMNGCCVPATRRLYVTTNGEYRICDRMGPSPSVGNVDTGIDFDRIEKYYLHDYCKEAIKYCNDCWAINLCGLCYVNSYNKDGIHLENRHNICQRNRVILENSLRIYHEILERNPSALECLNDIVTT